MSGVGGFEGCVGFICFLRGGSCGVRMWRRTGRCEGVRNSEVFVISLFVISLFATLVSSKVVIRDSSCVGTLFVCLLFSYLCRRLQVVDEGKGASVSCKVGCDLSVKLFAKPLNLFVFRIVCQFDICLCGGRAGASSPSRFFRAFCGVNSFIVDGSVTFCLFGLLCPLFRSTTFNF